jgi:hypothetical protein
MAEKEALIGARATIIAALVGAAATVIVAFIGMKEKSLEKNMAGALSKHRPTEDSLLRVLAPSTSESGDSQDRDLHVPQNFSPSSFGGRYQIESRVVADGCGGLVYWAAKHADLDLNSNTLFADIVDRPYKATFAANVIIIEANYSGNCANVINNEKWILRPNDGNLLGKAISQWAFPPNCIPCQTSFELTLTKQ